MATPIPLLSPEARILLLTAGPASNDAEIERLLQGPINWRRLSVLCTYERAAPGVWARVQHLAGEVPAEVRTHFGQVALVSDFRQAHLETQLLDVLRRLGEMDARVVLLKGAALATTVYPSFAARPMADVDLLLERDRAEGAHAELLRNGWKLRDIEVADADAAVALDAFYHGHHHLWPLQAVHGPAVRVEIHTDLHADGQPFAFGAADVWREARPVTYRGMSASVPSTGHLLLHLCLHFAWSHTFAGGSWRAYRDLQMLIDTGQVDWPAFVALAEHSRGTTCAYWTLRLASTLARVPVPDEVLGALRPSWPEPVLERLARHLAHDSLPTETICPSAELRKRMWSAAIQPRRSGHGAARPWLHAGEFPDPVAPGAKPQGVAKLRAHLRRGAQWRRFLRHIVAMSPDAA